MLKEHRRKGYLPISATKRFESISLTALPVIEIADEIYLGCVRGKLTENPVALSIPMHSVIDMVVYAFGQGPVDRISLLEVHNHLMTPVYDILIR